MKPYLVRYFHGTPPKSFAEKVERLCRKVSEDASQLFFDGTLSDFADKWQDKFLYIPAKEDQREFIEGQIFVTSKSSFGTYG